MIRQAVFAVALSSDGRRALSGSRDHTVRVWDLERQQPPRVLEGHTNWVFSVALSSDGRRALSGSGDRTVRVWDLEGQRPPRVLQGHTGAVFAVALSSDGRRGLSGSDDQTLRVWDLEHNKAVAVFTCDFPVCACAWTQGRIAAADFGGRLHVFAWEE